MIDPRVELGLDENAASPRDMPPRRRLFEGGSGQAPSTFHHDSQQVARSFAMETNSVREQAASLSSRAIMEGLPSPENTIGDDSFMGEHSLIEEDNEEDVNSLEAPKPYNDQNTGMTHVFTPYTDSPDVSMLDLLPPTTSPVRHDYSEFPVSTESSAPAKITVRQLVGYIPSVLVGSLLNILDGLSYGMIIMPLSHAVFANTQGLGLSLFYISTFIAQMVFSLGGSGFKACIGSEMIEIVPFFHALALTIATKLEGCSNEEILATTVCSFAVSCVVTGLTFFLLGWLKLGALVGFFPMHILLGCIGGVGWFLVATGLEVSARIDGGIEYNFETLQLLCRNWETIAQWGSCLALGCFLMFCERRLHHPLVVPTILVATFVLFHVVVAVVPQFSLVAARDHGWIFPSQDSDEPWWYVYTLYKPSLIHWQPILQCFPVMLALTFFGLIHVPINIPALAAATKEDSISVNRELIAHGLSNTLSGLCGSIQNYLVYTNSVMFVKSGADSQVAGVMLALMTAGLMFAGPGIIGFIPVIVVGSLIFMMGFDLIAEALYDTFGKVRKQDYATMVIITLIMGCYDFVVGIVAGIMLACLFFVISSGRRSPVQATMTAAEAHSTVIRHPVLQKYLQKVGKQVYIMRLTGSLFFGTNGRLEREVRDLSKAQASHGSSFATIRYLVIDLENVTDIDYCTVDTFLKLKRLLDASGIRLVLSGAETAGHKIRGLKAVDLVPETVDHQDPLSVRVFATLNIALSWCENQFIKEYYQQRAWFRKRAHTIKSGKSSQQSGNNTPRGSVSAMNSGAANHSQGIPIVINDFSHEPVNLNDPRLGLSSYGLEGSPSMASIHPPLPSNVLGTTPRSSFIRTEAKHAAHEDVTKVNKWHHHQQPLVLVMQIVDGISTKGVEFWENVVPFLTAQELRTGDKLPRGFHLVESGSFHIQFESGYYETAVAGTVLGELLEPKHTAAVIRAESDAKVWTLRPLSELQKSPGGQELTLEIMSVFLAIVSERYQRMTAYFRIAN